MLEFIGIARYFSVTLSDSVIESVFVQTIRPNNFSNMRRYLKSTFNTAIDRQNQFPSKKLFNLSEREGWRSLTQGFCLYLANPLTRDIKLFTDLFQGMISRHFYTKTHT